MAKDNNLTDFLTDVANAIRAKKGTTAKINPQDFSSEIANISTGGGDTPDIPVVGDGKTYLYIKIAAPGRMTVPLYFSQTVSNGVTIDWGDGSETQTLSGTGNKNTTHIYAEIGEYTISLNPSSGCTLRLGHNSSSYCVMGSANSSNKAYCNMLQAVEIGINVTSISNYAFNYCYSLSSVVIPDGVTSIGDNAFSSCNSLLSIVIPDSVTSIGDSAFNGCSSLSSVVIPNGITHINNYTFSGCYSLLNVVIPNSVTSIGNSVFSSCYSLASVVIPNGVTSIGDSAFNGCESLASIAIPDGLTSIGSSVLNGCESLASVVIPDGVVSIGNYAFRYCYSLSSLIIPESVTSIGNNAFNSCQSIAFYDFSQCVSVPTLGGTSVFSGITSDCKIIVPDALYDTWIAATNWSTHAAKIVKASEFNN